MQTADRHALLLDMCRAMSCYQMFPAERVATDERSQNWEEQESSGVVIIPSRPDVARPDACDWSRSLHYPPVTGHRTVANQTATVWMLLLEVACLSLSGNRGRSFLSTLPTAHFPCQTVPDPSLDTVAAAFLGAASRPFSRALDSDWLCAYLIANRCRRDPPV
ncbi:hypothetical protein DPV78_002568 [Talaromyces pinophilus]|nr:hypothetical protein DPV78_002568 [Talaromyces pinophilus]